MLSLPFNKAFSTSSYFQGDSDLKKEFLEKFISRKLILQEAIRLELDRDPQFLNDVQFFWEQSLLKLALSKKIKELSIDTQVSDQEIRDYYEHSKDVEFIDTELSDVYDQIKWIVLNDKQRVAVSTWSESLRKNINIEIDYKALEIEEK